MYLQRSESNSMLTTIFIDLKQGILKYNYNFIIK